MSQQNILVAKVSAMIGRAEAVLQTNDPAQIYSLMSDLNTFCTTEFTAVHACQSDDLARLFEDLDSRRTALHERWMTRSAPLT